VHHRLTDHPHIDAGEIEVQVNNGDVTLSGTIPDRRMKRLAEEVAFDVSGVHDVHNRLRVNAADGGQTRERSLTIQKAS
jgi:osmotically-inducible protein OsmY